jgi:serine/threonine protein kinase
MASFEELKLEVRRSRRLTHPNIVRIHDYLTDEDWAAVSMEYVDGENLSDVRVRQPGQVFDAAKLRPLIEQLCAALDYAHTRAKMVHHDLKPANCLVSATTSSLAGAPGPLAASQAEAARALPETGQEVRADQPRPRRAWKTILWVGAVLLMISAAATGWYWRVHLPAENARLIKIAEFEKEKRKKELEAKAADNAADKARLEAEARKAEEEIARLQTEREKKKQLQIFFQ